MDISKEQLAEILEKAKPSIVEGVKDELSRIVQQQILWGAGDVVTKFAKTWVTENVIPEVEKALVESKDGLVSLGVQMAGEIVNELAKAQVEEIKKNLENSYSRKKIFESLLG